MTGRALGYWTTTGIIGFVWLTGGAAGLAQRPENIEGLARLGYPAYVTTILGFWKVLGALALLAPGWPRLKEWAYAGTFFELTGAMVSNAVCGSSLAHVVWPAVFALCAVASWALRPPSRTLGSLGLQLRGV